MEDMRSGFSEEVLLGMVYEGWKELGRECSEQWEQEEVIKV